MSHTVHSVQVGILPWLERLLALPVMQANGLMLLKELIPMKGIVSLVLQAHSVKQEHQHAHCVTMAAGQRPIHPLAAYALLESMWMMLISLVKIAEMKQRQVLLSLNTALCAALASLQQLLTCELAMTARQGSFKRLQE